MVLPVLTLLLLLPLCSAQYSWAYRGPARYGASSFQNNPASPSVTRLTRHLGSQGPSQQLVASTPHPSHPSTPPPSITRFAPRTPAPRSHPLTLGSRRQIQPLFDVDKDNLISDGEAAVEEGGGWVVPPSLMAVAAVPGAPVRNVPSGSKEQTPASRQPKAATRQPKESPVTGDPYLQFMPVPAVPSPSTDTQAPRQPKDSLNSFDINLNLPNTVEEATTKVPTTRTPISRIPIAASRAPLPNPPAAKRNKAPAVTSTSEEDKKAARKKFKRCHGRCVQKQCLPVGNFAVYEKCQAKCRGLCT